MSGLRTLCGMPETEIADLVEALGKDVLEEAAHELAAFHATGAPTRRFTMLVSDGDGVMVEGDEASIGDGDAKDVAREVIEHGLRALAPTGDVNDPGCGPGGIVGGDQIGTFACQQGTELAAHPISEGLVRQEKSIAGWVPVAAILGNATAGHEAMDVGVVAPTPTIP